MLDSRTQDYRESCDARKSALGIWWMDGMIGDDTYLLSLEHLRYSRDEALGELYRLKDAKKARIKTVVG